MNTDVIRKELINLFKRTRNASDDLSPDLDNLMRKLSGYSGFNIPDMIQIEEEIINKVQKSSENMSTVIEVQNYIRKIRNMSIRDPAKLLYFLKELSPICKDSSDGNLASLKPFLRMARPIDNARTSTQPSTSIASFELSSQKRVNQSIKSIPASVVTERNNSALQKSNKSSHNYQISNEMTEHAIVGDLLYVIQGCNGQYFSWSNSLVKLELHGTVTVNQYMFSLISKIAKIGMAYSKIRAYVDRSCRSKSTGVVCQGLCSALNEHLASYTNLVSVLISQYNAWTSQLEQNVDGDSSQNHLTMDRLCLWLQEPSRTLLFLASILENTDTKKGGDLASALHRYLLNGAGTHLRLSRHLLLSAAEPIYRFIELWIFDGVLEECHQEFFVAVNAQCDLNSTWVEKYALRNSMIPSFISKTMAEKILLAGKSINFLREVCTENVNFKNKREFAKFRQLTPESMISQDVNRSFENMINTVSEETSKNLLKVLFTKYNLMGHLQALRNYMLQGQGDFILCLIELLGPELSKPSGDLHKHRMNGLLDEALKTSNAQFDSRDILDRIDIKLLKVSDNEIGWDIFTLNYHISDIRPLLAVVSNDSFGYYLRTFNFLFRSRRVHCILHSFFKKQNASWRVFAKMPEVSKVVHFSQIIIAEMLHFVNQIQYYINFEVLEASWKKFTEDVAKATDLTTVMTDHLAFLKQVTQRCLLEPEERNILSNLRSIYDLIMSIEPIITEMFSCLHLEHRQRTQYQTEAARGRTGGQWANDASAAAKEEKRRVEFAGQAVTRLAHSLRAVHAQYQTQVVTFLSALADHGDPSLQGLYGHLDNNHRYRDAVRARRRHH